MFYFTVFAYTWQVIEPTSYHTRDTHITLTVWSYRVPIISIKWHFSTYDIIKLKKVLVVYSRHIFFKCLYQDRKGSGHVLEVSMLSVSTILIFVLGIAPDSMEYLCFSFYRWYSDIIKSRSNICQLLVITVGTYYTRKSRGNFQILTGN